MHMRAVRAAPPTYGGAGIGVNKDLVFNMASQPLFQVLKRL